MKSKGIKYCKILGLLLRKPHYTKNGGKALERRLQTAAIAAIVRIIYTNCMPTTSPLTGDVTALSRLTEPVRVCVHGKRGYPTIRRCEKYDMRRIDRVTADFKMADGMDAILRLMNRRNKH